jgi:uncharacterized protein YdaL
MTFTRTSFLIAGSIAALSALLAGCGGRRPAPAERAAEHEPGAVNQFPSDRGSMPMLPPSVKQAFGAALGLSEAPGGNPGDPSGTLILYDDTGPYAFLGELYAIASANLASRFGPRTTKPVADYAPGDLARHRAAIYIGSTYDQPLPAVFLDDVASGERPVVWLYNNIWQLAARVPGFAASYGFMPWRYDTTPVASVQYKGRTLSRYVDNGSGIMEHNPLDPARAAVLASAVRADGSQLPWAVRANSLTYVGEIPFAYIAAEDRYLAFCDLLFDALEPAAPERHRALVRIEDVSPDTDPDSLQAIGDYLIGQNVPFSIALIPRWEDPNGVYSDGAGPAAFGFGDNPDLLAVLQDLTRRGGTLVMHGYTHQLTAEPNPYSGASADDFEFYRAHVDLPTDTVIYDGPVDGDSGAWALGRVEDGLQEIARNALPAPQIFEFPHYGGSAPDSRAIATRFPLAYHRGLYFRGSLTGAGDDHSKMMGQFFPYPVTDVFGWRLIPENLGNYENVAFNNHPARTASDLIQAAQANLVVRDGVASFYFHPYHDLAVLQEIVEGIRAAGYTFVGPHDL